MAQATGFLETFPGTPATPAPYTNPHNWDIFVQGFTQNESGNTVPGGDPRGGNLAQHGPNCEAPGFPYTPQNSHVMLTPADSVFECNGHLMTSPGLSGYSAIYMTPPAVADFSSGSTTVTWDMSTLRTSARDWVDVVLTPWVQQSQMAYNNNDQHIPPNNIHVTLAGTNVFLGYERIGGGTQYGQGTDVQINGDTTTTWDTVFAAQNPALVESAARRDTFQITLTRTTISVCMTGYAYGGQPVFCWMRNAQLPQALDPAVWNNQAAVQFNHRVYNAEKACIDTQSPPPANPLDQYNIDHSAFGEANCPNDTWHWNNFGITPFVPFAITKAVPENVTKNTTSASTINFASPSVAGGYLAFVQFSHTPDLAVSYNGGGSWHAPHIQPSIAPNNGSSEENGEAVFDPMPAGLTSVMIRGSNGFWGTFEAEGFHLIGPPSGSAQNPPPATATPTSTSVTPGTATPTPTATSVVAGGSSVVTFDSLTNPNRVLSGGYPNAAVNWGTTSWWLAGAYDHFITNSVSFNGSALRSASIALSTPARLVQLDADNGGTASTTVGLSCAGQPTVTTTVAPGTMATIRTNWTGTCSSLTLASSNGWDTNFDNLSLDSGSGSATATSTPTTVASTPTTRPTNTPTARPISTATPTATAVAGGQTVTFDTATGQNTPLNGQYPTGLINWGTNNWFLSGPVRSFTTKSISFISAGPTSESFSFVAPHRLVSVDAFNDDTVSTTITLSCAGQTSRIVTLAAGQVTTISTGWTGTCTTVTIASTNGWNTNFDNLRIV